MKLKDVVNSTAKLRDTLKTTQIEADLTSSSETGFTSEHILLFTALILRYVRKDFAGIKIQPLDPADISIEREEQITPEKLYSFVVWVLLSEASMTSDVIKMEDMKVKNPAMHQKILAMCQDIIYTGSRGKCRTPKHNGLGIAIHQLTQSRAAIELINKNGHGISYDAGLQYNGQMTE